MAVEQTDALLLQRVPYVDRVVIVSGEQESTADRKVNGVYAENNAVLGVNRNFLVSAHIEQAALNAFKVKPLIIELCFKLQQKLTVLSSDPVAMASPLGWNLTLFTSDKFPSNAWTTLPDRISQINAILSQLWYQLQINFS